MKFRNVLHKAVDLQKWRYAVTGSLFPEVVVVLPLVLQLKCTTSSFKGLQLSD